jgi:cytochrome P450
MKSPLPYSLGQPLARLKGQVAIKALLGCLPQWRLQVDSATLQWCPGWVVLGLHHVPVPPGMNPLASIL